MLRHALEIPIYLYILKFEQYDVFSCHLEQLSSEAVKCILLSNPLITWLKYKS